MSELTTHALVQWSGYQGLPDYSAFSTQDYAPCFEQAMAAHKAEIAEISQNKDTPSIANTIKAMEKSGEALSRVGAVFWGLTGAHTNPELQALERTLAPKLSAHYTSIGMDEALFARVDALYQQRDTLGLDGETMRVLEKTWAGFVRSGVQLSAPDKQKLTHINGQLAQTGTSFGQNVLRDEAAWAHFIEDEKALEGVPEFLKDAMKAEAATRGRDDAWCVSLSRSIIEPFLALCANRSLRKTAYQAFVTRGEHVKGENNYDLAAQTLALRQEKAQILGYADYAAYKLEHTMAGTADNVFGLLNPVWQAALKRVAGEQEALQKLITLEGGNHALEPWDWRYYAEKQRVKDYAFDEAELKPYLQLDNIIDAAFNVAGRLFGLTFKPALDAEVWHVDARIWHVYDANGTERGLFIGDYFSRASKRSGAWMSALKSQHKLDGGQMPIIYNIMNFAKPASGKPALLSLDDAKTLFHEFGHALHGLLSDVTWPSVSGTSVYRDFVELPSQLYEHWLTVPEILERYATHAETGAAMPQALLDKVLAAQNFNAGFQTIEYTASALVDMSYHVEHDALTDVAAFETKTLNALKMPDAIKMRHRTPHFQHIFAGDGYSAGYYSYLWSEVLDADAFAAFTEVGDVFDPVLAQKLKQHIYAAGGSQAPDALYKAFRGRMPTAEAMMQGRGLTRQD